MKQLSLAKALEAAAAARPRVEPAPILVLEDDDDDVLEGQHRVVAKLSDEILTLLEEGEIEEAALRLERLDHPKFHSVTQCRMRYAAVMREQRERHGGTA